ncbi:uncharacterized protein I303_103187 [Kwoniella dejecticola CBS 10117]|uniref:Aminoglycoside phosphotransferase domain-containing protein n=1 Tax=Kwoniella dejecticola CBS 10117 TaxID=1296121 RepID=A0A1A6AAU1_9TREE|nr:uncharacterized protein I303_03210 [Kwoniella dejecticola CBS 10117]OBR87186.1 hypothetical protein I303_03210 [Kwoniella dejecticola CBS 10117]
MLLPSDAESMVDDTMNGGVNYHFPLVFDDGIKWLVRVRQNPAGLSPIDFEQAVTRSEVATLRYLHSHDLAVPKAWMDESAWLVPVITPDHPLAKHVEYLFCESLQGKPNRWPEFGKDSLTNPGEKDKALIEDFARFQIQLHQIPVATTQIGSLTYPDQDQQVTPVIGPMVTSNWLHDIEPPYSGGPFRTLKERYLTQIDICLGHIADRLLGTTDTLDTYLWHLQLRELVDSVPYWSEPIDTGYIKHWDDKGDHLMVDDEGKLVGVIDWECAYVTTEAEAFAAPSWLYSLADSKSELTAAEKVLAESYERLGHPNLAHHVRNGKMYQRLLDIGVYRDYELDPVAQMEIIEVFEKTLPPDFLPPFRIGHEWRVYLMQRYSSDSKLAEVVAIAQWDREVEDEKAQDGKEEREAEHQAFWGMTFEQRKELKTRERLLADETSSEGSEEDSDDDSEATSGVGSESCSEDGEGDRDLFKVELNCKDPLA